MTNCKVDKRVFSTLIESGPPVHLIESIFVHVDGKRLQYADYNDFDNQNEYYDEYTSSIDVIIPLKLNFKERVIYVTVNNFGSFPDSKIITTSGPICPKLSNTVTLQKRAI